MSNLYTFKKQDRVDIIKYAMVELAFRHMVVDDNNVYISSYLECAMEPAVHQYYRDMAKSINCLAPQVLEAANLEGLISSSNQPANIVDITDIGTLVNILTTTDSVAFNQNTQLENLLAIVINQTKFQEAEVTTRLNDLLTKKLAVTRVDKEQPTERIDISAQKLKTMKLYYEKLATTLEGIEQDLKSSSQVAKGDTNHPLAWTNIINFDYIINNVGFIIITVAIFIFFLLLMICYFGMSIINLMATALGAQAIVSGLHRINHKLHCLPLRILQMYANAA